jgi:uncharacterized membrane protein YdjX (TVP38/TMEM64 family)
MTAFLNSLGPLSLLGFLCVQVLQVVISPIPGEVTSVIGGFLYGKILGIVLLAMAYKDKIEDIFKRLHSRTSKKSSKKQ